MRNKDIFVLSLLQLATLLRKRYKNKKSSRNPAICDVTEGTANSLILLSSVMKSKKTAFNINSNHGSGVLCGNNPAMSLYNPIAPSWQTTDCEHEPHCNIIIIKYQSHKAHKRKQSGFPGVTPETIPISYLEQELEKLLLSCDPQDNCQG